MKLLILIFTMVCASISFADDNSEEMLRQKTIEAVESLDIQVKDVTLSHPEGFQGNLNAFAGLFIGMISKKAHINLTSGATMNCLIVSLDDEFNLRNCSIYTIDGGPGKRILRYL